MNDWELIQNYCRNGSESAFETLVKRHVDYVYCAALRKVRDPSLAEDVSQAVFMLLARKAKSFQSGTVLVSWLFRTTHYVAQRALRSEFRRQRRELEAATMNPTTTTPDIDHQWERVSPILDEALAALPNKDRDAVLLRFISRKSFSEVGSEIGASEDAAKKRVTRALARLKEFFVRRGTTLSVAAIAAMLGERMVQASPAALATKITALSAAGSAAASSAATALLKTTLRDLFWTRLRWGAAISAGLMAVLWLGTTALRPAQNQAITPASSAPVAEVQPPADSNRAAAEDSNPKTNATQHTLSLLVVRAEDRKPVSGARVLVESWTSKGSQRAFDATTDGDGLLDIPVPASEFDEIKVWVSAEGRVPMDSSWRAHEFNEPLLTHTLLLEPGQSAAGTVVDESGNPVAGAKVSFWGPGIDLGKRDNACFHPELSESFTDSNGRWSTTQLPPEPLLRQVRICIRHPNLTQVQPDVGELPGFPTNALVTLSNGVALSGRVIATDGTPIENARVAKQSGSFWSTKTDADGRFSWPHVEPGKVFVDVDVEGFETQHEFVLAANAVNECTITFTSASNHFVDDALERRRVRLHGTVVDADTGEPISSFRVVAGRAGYFGASTGNQVILSAAELLGEGRDGKFDWQILPNSAGPQLQVEAEGYFESVTDGLGSNADQEFNFKLQRGQALVGRVVTPDGAAVANAIVSLTGPGIGPVMQSPAQFLEPNPGFAAMRTRTDGEGAFRLKVKTGARGVAVIHESGCAILTFAAATNSDIVLQPWGSIDGTLYLNGQPAAKQTISISGKGSSDSDTNVFFSFSYRNTTDEQGHFQFKDVPPGEQFVARSVGFTQDGAPYSSRYDHSAKVKVESGAVASVELRRQGRPVVGRIVYDGTPDDLYWGYNTALLEDENKKVIPFALSKDGSIRADDVPSGTYRLSIQLMAATVHPQMNKKMFGSMKREVVVPAAEDETAPVDLGELTVEKVK